MQRELKKATRDRKRLILLSASKDWREAAEKQRIRESYWPLVAFPELSMKSQAKWWEFLWPLIQKKRAAICSAAPSHREYLSLIAWDNSALGNGRSISG
jgi:hypothetical protein